MNATARNAVHYSARSALTVQNRQSKQEEKKRVSCSKVNKNFHNNKNKISWQNVEKEKKIKLSCVCGEEGESIFHHI